MLTVNAKPPGFFRSEYKSTYPALANGQPVNKTAAIPVGQGLYRRVDTSKEPMWRLPSQFVKKSERELALLASRRPKEALPTIFARAADPTFRSTTERVSHQVRQNGIQAILGNLIGHLVPNSGVHGDDGGQNLRSGKGGGLHPFPGSTRYYSERRQAIATAPTGGIPTQVSFASARKKMQQKGYLDANGITIQQKPQTF